MTEKKERKPLSEEAARNRMASLCARSEMCESEIRIKLQRALVPADTAERIIDFLIENRFIDNARYARAFASDKAKFSGWGRNKIRMALIAKRIPESLITEALVAIDHPLYADALIRTARDRAAGLDLEDYSDRAKLCRRLLSRGYEMALVTSVIDHLRKERKGE